MEARLKAALDVSSVKETGVSGGGCINRGCAYKTEKGTFFVKMNADKEKARVMFEGEFEGLNAILATKTVRVPKPIVVLEETSDDAAALVMECVEMAPLSKQSAKLGTLLAKLHLHNEQLLKNKPSSSAHKASKDGEGNADRHVKEFGFHTATCCGYIPQDNTWNSDWVEFFAQQRIQPQLNLIEKEYGDREALELWSQLQEKLPSFFQGITIYPSLLHGDLWNGNTSEVDSEPFIFDPACFYGHSEFELSIAKMFGGFSSSFFAAYHRILPPQPGFDKRMKLYQLFHYLNHWNHFGGGYRGSSISTMRILLK